MNRHTDGEKVYEQTYRWRESLNRQTDVQLDRQIYIWTDKWNTDRWTDEQTYRWRESRWTDKQME